MANTPVTELIAEPKKKRQGRSPAFPFISLEKAIERAEAFRVAEGGRPKHFSPLVSACKAWGIGAQTGMAAQTVAALGHYDLFEFEGTGDKRSAKLTELAFRILLDKQPISPEREAAIKEAALKPKIHAELWQKWQEGLPSDPTIETFLVRDRGFSETGARDLIAEYRETIAFAKLTQSVTIPSVDGTSGEVYLLQKQVPEVGDFVQVEIDGALQFEKPVRVRAIQDHDGQKWVFVDGSKTGVLMEQVTVELKGAGAPKGGVMPPVLDIPDLSPVKGTRREVFALDEGDVVLTFPENLSAASFGDLEDYIEVFLRKAKRRAGIIEPSKPDDTVKE